LAETALRVLMIAPTPYFSDRGCHVRIYEEARNIMKRGHEVRIVTYHLGRDMPGVAVVRTPLIPWYKKLEAGPSWHKPYLDVLLLAQAYRTARTFKPHLIHAHLHEGVLIGYLLKKLLRVPLLFDYQGSLSGESLNHEFFKDSSLLQRSFQALERFINGCADAIITSSGEGRQELLRDWEIAPQAVSTLIDGVDTDIFKPFPRAQSRRELGISEYAWVIVYLGLLNSYQGIDLLFEALTLLRRQVPQVHCLLMGYPDQEYRQKAQEMGLADMITFTGRVPYGRAPAYLCAGDLAVSPKLARTEANGKLFNYMACGLPTVAFESDVNREILGEAGIYAEYGSSFSLAECIASAFQDENAMLRLGRESRVRAIKFHSWHERTEQLESVYRRLLNI
jgi:glycosyltransferase involved in cell wall biosynthesis